MITLLLYTVACNVKTAPAPSQPTSTPLPSETPIFHSGATPVPILLTQAAMLLEPTVTQTPIQSTPSMAAGTPSAAESTQPVEPTPDLRLDPEDWQNWPIVPQRVSAGMQQVYLHGLAAGNNPNAFSKIGDCQNIPSAFLGFFDVPGNYQLVGDSDALQETIDHFSGSFSRNSQAVRGGFNVASVLSPLWADLEACAQGETPLECEFRIHRPSIVFISMETWFPGRTSETYVGYLRQIIDYTIAQGAVPILATKADNTEGDHSINLAIATLAYEYDLPLWNFWRAVQPLKDHGIDWGRDATGFHITVEGWNVRSFTALAALDSVYRMLNAPAAPADAINPTPTPSAPAVSSPPVFLSTAFEGSTSDPVRIWLSLGERVDGVEQTSGAMLVDNASERLTALTQAGFRLVDVASDGKAALLSQSDILYWAGLTTSGAQGEPVVITERFFSEAERGAIFLPEAGFIAYLEKADPAAGTLQLFSYSLAENRSTLITTGKQNPILLYPLHSGNRLFWENGECTAGYASCQATGVFWSDWQEQESGSEATMQRPVVGPNSQLAYFTVDADGYNNLYVTLPTLAQPRLVLKTAIALESYAWSPDGSRLAIIEADQSDYSNRVLERRYRLFKTSDFTLLTLTLDDKYRPTTAVWAPDGQKVLFIGMDLQITPPHLVGWTVDLTDPKAIVEQSYTLDWGEAFPYLQGVFWLPP